MLISVGKTWWRLMYVHHNLCPRVAGEMIRLDTGKSSTNRDWWNLISFINILVWTLRNIHPVINMFLVRWRTQDRGLVTLRSQGYPVQILTDPCHQISLLLAIQKS